MNIASRKIDELARRLAGLTGEDVETALERALADRLSRVQASAGARGTAALQRFFETASKARVLDARPPDDILGYGSDGTPG